MLRLVRDKFTKYDTTGILYTENGRVLAYTLEDPVAARPGSKPCIPTGIYPIVLSMSSRFNRVMPRIEQVPGRTGILIHPGNTEKDTTGCVLVGTARRDVNTATQYIVSSRVAFEQVYTEIMKCMDRGPLRISIEQVK